MEEEASARRGVEVVGRVELSHIGVDSEVPLEDLLFELGEGSVVFMCSLELLRLGRDKLAGDGLVRDWRE